MADDRYDELYRMRQAVNQKIAEQTVAQINNEYQSNVQNAYESAAAGRWDDAAYHARAARQLETEALPYVQAAQRQAAQQSPFTPKQQQILDKYPGIRNDPKKWAEAEYWDKCLRVQGFDPNSDAYASRMLLGLGVQGADGAETVEIASPDTIVETVRNSKYAGDFTRADYDQLAQYRDALKAHGFYRMDEQK
jgi:hypothetical protein